MRIHCTTLKLNTVHFFNQKIKVFVMEKQEQSCSLKVSSKFISVRWTVQSSQSLAFQNDFTAPGGSLIHSRLNSISYMIVRPARNCPISHADVIVIRVAIPFAPTSLMH